MNTVSGFFKNLIVQLGFGGRLHTGVCVCVYTETDVVLEYN